MAIYWLRTIVSPMRSIALTEKEITFISMAKGPRALENLKNS